MLPRESDATVDVNARLRSHECGAGGHDESQLGIDGCPGADGLVKHRVGKLHAQQHVSATVLDRLERPDGRAELASRLRVFDGCFQARASHAELLGTDREQSAAVSLRERVRGRVAAGQQPCRRVRQPNLDQPAGGVEFVRRSDPGMR